MNILLDENAPQLLRKFFPDDAVATVQQLGWSGVTNGELVSRAEDRFDVLIHADKNLRYQQNLMHRKLAFVGLPTNRWPLFEAIAPRIVIAAHAATPGSFTIVEL